MKKKTKKTKRSLPLIQVIRDIKNYKKWIQTIKSERENKNSKFNKLGLNHNYFYVLYLPVTLGEENLSLPDHIKKLRVVEMLTPVHQYLDNDLGFADYIIPEFNQFYDEDNNPTLTYGIVYRFAFKKFSLKWVTTRLFLLSLITWALIKFPIISSLWGMIF